MKVRLDRGVANGEFTRLFDGCYMENVITTTFDHYAVLIQLSQDNYVRRSISVQRGFKFEAMWLRADDYKEIVELAWEEGRDGSMSFQSTWSNLNRVAVCL